MRTKNELPFTLDILVYPLLFVFLLWLAFWAEVRFKTNFNYLGIYPKSIEGLRGVLFSPFIHSGVKHLFNNSMPLLVLSTALFYFYRSIRWKVLLYGMLLTGIVTWLIGRPALHIGASGVVYMLASFLFFKGVFSKHFRLIALSLVVVFLYGSLLWYLFPINPEISWEGHLSGFLVGLVFALLFRKNPISQRKYDWEHEDYNAEEDVFLQHFDENGNFVPASEREVKDEELDEDIPKTVIYTFRTSKKIEKDL